MKCKSGFFRAAAALIVLLPSIAAAQSLGLTAPTSPREVAEGDDFATIELGNPWDFSERRDIGWEENFDAASINVNNGVWTASNAVAGGYVFPLFPGFKDSLFAEGLPGDKSLPKFGINHRIDTSKYNLLSYRLKHSQRGTLAVYWEGNENRPQYWPDPESPFGAAFDGFYHWGWGVLRSGWNVYAFDMRNTAAQFEQRRGDWSGSPYVLRIDPSVGGGVGAVTEIDWVRLVDPNSAPELTIRWNSSGLSPFHVITVWVDDDRSGHDGTPIAFYAGGSNPGSHVVKTAMFPPGDYYFYVTAETVSAGQYRGDAVRSGYSARLHVVQKPRAFFTSPTPASGDEYAGGELGNPWDMDGPGDVPNLNSALWPPEWRQFSAESFAASRDAQDGNIFQAVADAPWRHVGNNESDVQVHLNISATRPINPQRYRYLTYRIAADESNYPTLHDKVSRGWVTRPVFWNSNIITDAGRPKAHVLYEGWHTYTVDLWNSNIIEQGSPWTSFSRIQNLRIDPLETDVPTWFFVDWVKLTGDNRAVNDNYTVSFQLENLDPGRTATVDLYYDPDNNWFDGTHIGRMERLTPGTHSFNWSTAGLQDGSSYYIYMVIDDGVNTSRVYAPVPVVIGAFVADPEPRSQAPEMDYDGDGTSDQCVYRPAAGMFFQNRSREGFWARNWGNAAFRPIHGDFDGDQRTDNGLVVNLAGFYYWYITRSSDGGLYSAMWGLATDDIVIADYNGNGRDEIGVFRAGAWFVLDEAGGVSAFNWGLPGDIPLPRDYDGDGRDDIAIWRPGDGMWWILYSGYETGFADNYFAAIQWGLPGDIPVPADWSGDGRVDPAVFRPGLGMWYTRDVRSGEWTATQWGLPGDEPVVGDYNGDGVLDLTVFRPPLGMWYHNHRNGQWTARQFGLPGDLLPQKAK